MESERQKQLRQSLYDQLEIDSNAAIVFQGKHFVFDFLSYSFSPLAVEDEHKYIDIVKANGGIIHSNAIKIADYFVAGSDIREGYFSS